MITGEQRTKARTFLSLHTNGELLILPNICNPIGARVLEHQGYPVVATASASIAESQGYEEGENIRLETMLDVLFRISRSVRVPVTADIEAGCTDTVQTLKINRVSFGPQVFRSCLSKFVGIAADLKSLGNYECFADGSLIGMEMSRFLISGKEQEIYSS